MMTRNCPRCGVALRVESRFCPACGQALDQGQTAMALDSVSLSGPGLIIRVVGEPQREVTLDRSPLTMGRAPDNDIVLMHGFVSAHHGQFERQGAVWHYTDLGSTNGTYVNGQRQEHTPLHNGDVLRIGETQGNSVGLTFRATAETGMSVYQQVVSQAMAGSAYSASRERAHGCLTLPLS